MYTSGGRSSGLASPRWRPSPRRRPLVASALSGGPTLMDALYLGDTDPRVGRRSRPRHWAARLATQRERRMPSAIFIIHTPHRQSSASPTVASAPASPSCGHWWRRLLCSAAPSSMPGAPSAAPLSGAPLPLLGATGTLPSVSSRPPSDSSPLALPSAPDVAICYCRVDRVARLAAHCRAANSHEI